MRENKQEPQNIVVTYTANTKPLVEQIGAVEKAAKSLRDELEKLNKITIDIKINTIEN